ncbi:MAG TPA: hypothetical protein O0X01_03715 [Methanocorpusculum sp.]|nr:hypothetical protein [Methanocorpusculum sp.]
MTEVQKILVSMTCPSCGGQVQCEEGEDMVLCKFCESVFALTSDEGSNKVMYKMTVDKSKALAKVAAWFSTGPKAKDLPTSAVVSEAYPMYLPFWRLVARGKACVCGIEEERSGKDNEKVEIPREALINREYIYSEIACEAGDLGIQSIVLPQNAEAIVYDDQNIVTFGVTSSRDAAYDVGGKAISQTAVKDGSARMSKVYFSKSFFFPKAFTLVYYPFWIVRYAYEGRTYFATVDGITARVVSGRAPGNAGSQSTAAGVGGAISGGALGIGIGLAIVTEGTDVGVGVLVVGVVAAIALLGYFYNRFRYGDEVLEGAMTGKGLKSGRTQEKVQSVYNETYDYFK